MIEKTSEFRQTINELWPDVGDQAIILDKELYIPTLDEMVAYFKVSKLSELQPYGEMMECDKYARLFWAEVTLKRYYLLMNGDLSEEKKAPIGLACTAYGNMFRGINLKHVVNLAKTESGVYLFDLMPDANRYWKADVNNDNVQILVM